MHEVIALARRHSLGIESGSAICVPDRRGTRRWLAGGLEMEGGDGTRLPRIRLGEIYAMVHKVSLDFPSSRFSLWAMFNFYSSPESESISLSEC